MAVICLFEVIEHLFIVSAKNEVNELLFPNIICTFVLELDMQIK